MEKQKFLMEVIDIANGQGKSFEPTALALVREAIRAQAKTGLRQYSVPIQQLYISVNGVNLFLGEDALRNISTSLKEDGFGVEELHGYYQIKW